MYKLLSNSKIKKSRKDYDCDASVWLQHHLDHVGTDTGLTFSEFRDYIKAKEHDFEIKKGEPYIRQQYEYAGEVQTFRVIPEIHNINLRLNLYSL